MNTFQVYFNPFNELWAWDHNLLTLIIMRVIRVIINNRWTFDYWPIENINIIKKSRSSRWDKGAADQPCEQTQNISTCLTLSTDKLYRILIMLITLRSLSTWQKKVISELWSIIWVRIWIRYQKLLSNVKINKLEPEPKVKLRLYIAV